MNKNLAQNAPESRLIQIRVSDSWAWHIKVQAAQRGSTIKDLVLAALRAFIGEPPQSIAKPKANRKGEK